MGYMGFVCTGSGNTKRMQLTNTCDAPQVPAALQDCIQRQAVNFVTQCLLNTACRSEMTPMVARLGALPTSTSLAANFNFTGFAVEYNNLGTNSALRRMAIAAFAGCVTGRVRTAPGTCARTDGRTGGWTRASGSNWNRKCGRVGTNTFTGNVRYTCTNGNISPDRSGCTRVQETKEVTANLKFGGIQLANPPTESTHYTEEEFLLAQPSAAAAIRQSVANAMTYALAVQIKRVYVKVCESRAACASNRRRLPPTAPQGTRYYEIQVELTIIVLPADETQATVAVEAGEGATFAASVQTQLRRRPGFAGATSAKTAPLPEDPRETQKKLIMMIIIAAGAVVGLSLFLYISRCCGWCCTDDGCFAQSLLCWCWCWPNCCCGPCGRCGQAEDPEADANKKEGRQTVTEMTPKQVGGDEEEAGILAKEPEEDPLENDPKYKTFIQNLTNGGFFQRRADGQPMVGAEYEARLARARSKWEEMTQKAKRAGVGL